MSTIIYPTNLDGYKILNVIILREDYQLVRAFCKQVKEVVAIKIFDLQIIAKTDFMKSITKIQNEMISLKKCRSGHVCNYLCAFVEKHRLYLVLEYLEGSVMDIVRFLNHPFTPSPSTEKVGETHQKISPKEDKVEKNNPLKKIKKNSEKGKKTRSYSRFKKKLLKKRKDKKKKDNTSPISGDAKESTFVYGGIEDEILLLSILKQVLIGLDYLHQKGIIHRYLKGDHLLISQKGVIKLGGFYVTGSIFNFFEQSVERTTSLNISGTDKLWQPPEMLKQVESYNEKVDIWSFGMTALELIHGCHPYADLEPLDAYARLISGKTVTVSEKEFSGEFKKMIDSCLQTDPVLRPSAKKLLSLKLFKKIDQVKYVNEKLDLHQMPTFVERTTIIKGSSSVNSELIKRLEGKEDLFVSKDTIQPWNFDEDDEKKKSLKKIVTLPQKVKNKIEKGISSGKLDKSPQSINSGGEIFNFGDSKLLEEGKKKKKVEISKELFPVQTSDVKEVILLPGVNDTPSIVIKPKLSIRTKVKIKKKERICKSVDDTWFDKLNRGTDNSEKGSVISPLNLKSKVKKEKALNETLLLDKTNNIDKFFEVDGKDGKNVVVEKLNLNDGNSGKLKDIGRNTKLNVPPSSRFIGMEILEESMTSTPEKSRVEVDEKNLSKTPLFLKEVSIEGNENEDKLLKLQKMMKECMEEVNNLNKKFQVMNVMLNSIIQK